MTGFSTCARGFCDIPENNIRRTNVVVVVTTAIATKDNDAERLFVIVITSGN